VKAEIEAAIADLKSALEKDDTAEIKTKSQALAGVAMKMGEAIYAKQQGAEGQAAGDGQSAGGAGDSDVVDADFEEVKDDKKSA
jgi:molecular chaperone DnaK